VTNWLSILVWLGVAERSEAKLRVKNYEPVVTICVGVKIFGIFILTPTQRVMTGS